YRFQLKYGSNVGGTHELWQDQYGLYTTLLFGVSPEEEFFIAYDPVLHSPTKYFISLEFKEAFVEDIQRSGWSWQERQGSGTSEDPVEVLVGGKPKSFLDYIRFERESKGEDQGHRALLAEGRAPILKPRIEVE